MTNLWLRDDLTPKQAEYIADLASGLSTLEIAHQKVVSHHTVRNTIAKAKERVGASSTANLIAWAIWKGWAKPNGSRKPPLRFEPINTKDDFPVY